MQKSLTYPTELLCPYQILPGFFTLIKFSLIYLGNMYLLFILFSVYLLMGIGPHSLLFRDYSQFCTWRITTSGTWGTVWCQQWNQDRLQGKASTITPILSLQPLISSFSQYLPQQCWELNTGLTHVKQAQNPHVSLCINIYSANKTQLTCRVWSSLFRAAN